MQDCFREYPEIYAAEIADDEEPIFDSSPTDESAGLPSLTKEEPPKPEPTEIVAKSPASVTESIKEKVAEAKEEVKEKAALVKEEIKAAIPDKTPLSEKEAPKPEPTKIVVKSPAPVTGAVKERVAQAKGEVKEKIPDKTHDATAANEGQ